MTNEIARLNDQLRQTLGIPTFGTAPGKIYMTEGVYALPPEIQIAIWAEVRDFDYFTEENDPYGERNFGSFEFDGAGRIFWKIDYYAPDMMHGSEDPADPDKIVRVLTVMLASEY